MITDHALAISAVPLFVGLCDSELARLARLLQAKTLPGRCPLLFEETCGETTYIVREGSVKVEVVSYDGREVILAVLGRGELVGEMSLVDSLDRSASVVTLEPTTFYMMDRKTFWACLETMPGMAFNLACILSHRLREANTRIRITTTLDVEGRVAKELLALAAAHGEPVGRDAVRIPIPLTQGDIAALIGASRVRVNQVLMALRETGDITLDERRRLVLQSPTRLAARYES